MKKKWIAGILVLCMVISLLPSTALAAEEGPQPAPYNEGQSINYEQLYSTAGATGGVSITGLNANYVSTLTPDGDGLTRISLVIPAQIGGRDVVEIGAEALGKHKMTDPIYENVRFTEIDLSNATELQKIGEMAFYNMTGSYEVYEKLDSTLTIPNGITTIGGNAFGNLKGLHGDLLLPDSVESIGDSAFAWTGLDGTLKLPDNPAYTKVNMQFAYESPITAIAGLTTEGVFPSAITELGKNAFGYTNITGDVVLPDTITVLNSAFQGSQIDSLYVPKSVTDIASTIIADCDQLKWARLDFDSTVNILNTGARFMGSGNYRSDLNVVLNNQEAYDYLKGKTYSAYQNRLTYQTTLSFSGLDSSYDRPVLYDRPINWEVNSDGYTYFENTDYKFPKGTGNAWSFQEGDAINTVAESDKATSAVLYPVTAEPKVTITTSGNIQKVYDGKTTYFTVTATLPEGYELKTSATAQPGDYFMHYQWYSWSQGINKPVEYTKIYSGPANAIGFSDVADSLDGSYDSNNIAHGYFVIVVYYKRNVSDNTLLRREDIYFTVSITKATPAVTPEYPAVALAGKKLADLPLLSGEDAGAGTITWTDAAESVSVGSGEYGWQFTPEDTDNYEIVTGAAAITGKNGSPVTFSDSVGVGQTGTQVRADDAISRTETQGDQTVLTVAENETVTILPGTPAQGYRMSAVTVETAAGASVAAERQEDGVYTFTMPNEPVNAAVMYRKEYTVTATAGEHGVVSPAGAVAVADGDAQTFTFTPDYGYKLSRVTVDGAAVQVTGNTFTFTPEKDCAIAAAFEKMVADDLDEMVDQLPEDSTSGGQSAIDEILDAKMHYEAVKDELGAADKAAETLNEKLAQLPNVQVRVDADAAEATLQNPGSLLENMTREDAEALKTGAIANFEIVLGIAEAEPEDAVQASIENALGGASVASHADVTVKKIITDARDNRDIVEISELKRPVVLVFPIPEELRQASGNVSRDFVVLRTHMVGGAPVTEALPDEDDSLDTYTVRSGQFSVYTLAYQDTQRESSGSSGSATYPVAVADGAAHGTVTVNRHYAARNTTVTVTVKPDAGYALDTLTVTGPNGKSVAVTDAGNGVYKFQMPGGRVTVAAAFTALDGCEYSDHCAAKRFTDVPAESWYHEAVDYVVEQGMMKGESDTIFAPFGKTTRGMLAAILYRREGSPAPGSGSVFTDVATNRYDTAAITWASAQGIVTGYGNGLFGPDDALTREQLAAILYRYARIKGYDGSAGADLSAFRDAAQISAYAKEAVGGANAAGLITGKGGGLLDPGGNAQRSETAAILMRLFRYLEV